MPPGPGASTTGSWPLHRIPIDAVSCVSETLLLLLLASISLGERRRFALALAGCNPAVLSPSPGDSTSLLLRRCLQFHLAGSRNESR